MPVADNAQRVASGRQLLVGRCPGKFVELGGVFDRLRPGKFAALRARGPGPPGPLTGGLLALVGLLLFVLFFLVQLVVII